MTEINPWMVKRAQAAGSINRMRREGMADEAIAQQLMQDPDFGHRINKGLNDGLTTGEIVGFLSRPPQRGRFDEAVQNTGTLEGFAANIGRGMVDTGTGAVQLGATVGNKLGLVSDEAKRGADELANRDVEALDALAADRPISSTIGRGIGAGAALAPLGVVAAPAKGASAIAKGLNFAGQGAVAGATQPVTDPENFGQEKFNQTAVGAIGGAILPPVIERALRLGGRAFGSMANFVKNLRAGNATAVKIVRDSGVDVADLSDDVFRMLEQQADELDNLGALTPEQRVNDAAFKAVGTKGTAGQITRDFGQARNEQRLAGLSGVGDDLRNRLAGQDEALVGFVRKQAEAAGGRAGSRADSGRLVQSVVRSGFKEREKEITALYNQARNAKGLDAVMDADDFIGRAGQTIDDFEDVIPSPVVKRIKQFAKTLDDKGNPQAPERALTIAEAEKLDKFINSRMDPTNRAQFTALGRLKADLRATEDLLGQAGDEAGPLFKKGKAAFKRNIGEKEIKGNKAVLSGNLAEEDTFRKLVIGSSEKDLKAFKKSLLRGSPEQVKRGRQALNELATQAIEFALDKATSETADGVVFSGKAFEKALAKSIGQNKLNLLIEDEGIRRALGTVVRVGRLRVPPPGSTNPSGTFNALLDAFITFGRKIPFTGKIREALQAHIDQQAVTRSLDPSKFATEANRIANRQALSNFLRDVPLAEVGGALAENIRRN